MNRIALSILAFLCAAPAYAQIVSTYPKTWTFGESPLRSSDLNGNFAHVRTQVNANAAANGTNADITNLTALAISGTPAVRWAATTGMFWNGTDLGWQIGGVNALSCTASLCTLANIRLTGAAAPTTGADLANKTYVDGKGVPTGAVMYFRLSACPSGWAPLNGTGGFPDYRGRFVRSLNTSGSGIDPGRTLGSFQDHQFQSHVHQFNPPNGLVGASGAAVNAGIAGASNTSGPVTGNTGAETRPTNVALLLCEKT